ncbi:MAG: hypothetical protein SH857_15665 [Chitinophagales bacterium]|nr:hypothetical protein [Chitinophagales bacterium]
MAQIKEKLHRFIDNGDERFLKVVYIMAKECLEGEQHECELTDDQVKVLNERREPYLRGEGKTYTIEETISAVRSQKRKK